MKATLSFQKSNSRIVQLSLLLTMLLCFGLGTKAWAQSYPSVSFSSSVEPICRVIFNTIDNSSSCSTSASAYEDYTSVSTSLTAGNSYDITVYGNTDGSYTNYIKVFFDFNRDGDFSDDDESYEIGTIYNCSSCSTTSSITIPSSATSGAVRMRVVKNYGSYGTYSGGGFGQAEDYTVNIVTSGGSGSGGGSITLTSNVSQEIACGSTYNFYDSGGSSGSYSNSQSYTATFTSTGNITINFSQFETESNSSCYSWDYMYIYDGTTSGTQLAYGTTNCSSANLTTGVNYTATSGTMTVVWVSDGSNTAAGWAATITASGCSGGGGDATTDCEGFEGGSMPSGWTSTGAATWSVGTGDYSSSTGSNSGSYNALITHGTSGNETYLVSPTMDLSGASSASVSFSYVNRSWAGDIDYFGVYYRVNGGSWNELFSTTSAHSTWTAHTVDLEGLAANYQVGFKFTDKYGYGVGLDDICFSIIGGSTAVLPTKIKNNPTEEDEMTWAQFVDFVSSGKSYAGKTVTLEENISVSTMVGTSSTPFKGTFDGQGHKITVNISSSEQGAAPFRYISGATIENLEVSGTVTSTAHHASGLVGFCAGTVNIRNCLVHTNVSNSNGYNGDSGNNYMGGLIGHNQTATTTIEGCVYDGKLTSAGFKGVMFGFAENNANITVRNSYACGTYSTNGYTSYDNFSPIGVHGSSRSVTLTFSNFYYSIDQTSFTASGYQGTANATINGSHKHGYTITGDGVTVAMSGTPTEYDVSGISAYTTGIVYNNTIYAGQNDQVALSLSGSPTGQYEADHGTLNGSTLTMAAANTQISALLCLKPTAITITNLERISMTVNWTKDANATNNDFQLVCSTSELNESALASATKIDVTGTTYDLTNLERGTTYYIYVRGNCGNGDYSKWIGTSATTKDLLDCETASFGSGTSTATGIPMQSNWGNSYSQQIFTAEELLAQGLQAGQISKLSYTWNGNGTYEKELSFYMGTTSKSVFSSTTDWETGLQLVYGPVVRATTGNSGTIEYTFTTPFDWDGTSNIVLGTLVNQYGSAQTGSGFTAYSSSASATRSMYKYQDSNPLDPSNLPSGSTSSYRANVVFTVCNLLAACPAVTNLTHTYNGDGTTSVTVSWEASTGDYANTYDLFYSTSEMSDFSGTPQYTGTATSYTMTGLTPNTEYYVYVRCTCNANNHNDGTSEVAPYQFATRANCIAPTNPVATLTGKTSVNIAWIDDDDNPQNNNYKYILSTQELTDLSNQQSIVVGSATEVALSNLDYSTHYYFYVFNHCGDIVSEYAQTEFDTRDECPGVRNLQATAVTANTATLTWESDEFGDENEWYVYVLNHNNLQWYPTERNFTVFGLEAGTEYTVAVSAHCWDANHTIDAYSYGSEIPVTTPAAVGSCETVGTGTSTYSLPVSIYDYAYTQMIYTADNFSQSGAITSLKLQHSSSDSYAMNNMKVYLGTTTKSTFSSTTDWVPENAFTEIYSGSFPTGTEWIELTLTTPFTYNGTDNLVVAISNAHGNWNQHQNFYYTSVSNTVLYRRADGDASYANYPGSNAGYEVSSYRTNIQFCFEPTSCPPVRNLAVNTNELTSYSAEISWLPGGSESSWLYYYEQSDVVRSDDELANQNTQLYNADLSITLNALRAGLHYYFYIKPNVPGDNSCGWQHVDFTTVPTCFPPTNIVVDNITNNSATVEFTGTDNALNYTIAYLHEEGSEDVWQYINNVTTQPVTLTGLIPHTTYFVYVKTICEMNGNEIWDQSSYSDYVSFTTKCNTPTALSHSDVTDQSAVLTWSGDADNYRIQYTPAGGSASTVTVTGTTTTLTGLAASTLYTVRVQSDCGANSSDWIEDQFTTGPECVIPSNLAVSYLAATSATIEWTGTNAANSGYDVRYSWLTSTIQQLASYDFESTSLPTVFTTNASYGFTTTTNSYYGGSRSAKSNNGGTNSSTAEMVLTVTVPAGGATLSFWAKISSEASYDQGYFLIDGTAQSGLNGISGNGSWILYTFTLTPGTHTLTWRYTKDSSVNGNDDCFYVDDIVLEGYGSESITIHVGEGENSATLYPLTPNTEYTVQVQSDCGNYESDWSTPITFTPMCFQPTALTVYAQTIGPDSAVVHWNDSEWHSEGSYQYVLTTAGQTPNWANATTTTNRTHTLHGLNDYTDYVFYVRSSCGNELFSDPVSVAFSTPEWCAHPDQLTVNEVHMRGADLSWNERGEATQWTFQYATNESFTQGLQSITVNNDPSISLSCLTTGTTYYARVKANCSNNYDSRWSNTVSFVPVDYVYENRDVEREIGVGGTSTNSYLPTYIFYNYSLTQQLYTPAEIGSAGTINSISFYCLSSMNRTLDIYLVNTTKETFANGTDWIPVTTSNRVFSGSISTTAGAWNTITLSTPFEYDGTSNLAFIVDDNTGTYTSSVSSYVFDATSQAIRVFSDGTNYNPAAPSSYSGAVMNVKNQIKLGMNVIVLAPSSTADVEGEIASGEVETCQSESSVTIASLKDGDVETYNWYRNGTRINSDDAHGASYTITLDELRSLTPGNIYTYTRKAYDECTQSELLSRGEYKINLLAPLSITETISNNTPIYCGFDAQLSVSHDDNYQHFWYSDAGCTNLFYSGETVTLPQMTETDTLWYKEIKLSDASVSHSLLQEDFTNGLPSNWSTVDADGDGYGWSVFATGVTDHSGNLAQCVTSQSYDSDAGALNPDNWLITPALSIPLASSAELTFWVAAQDEDYPYEHYGVYISTTGTNPSDFIQLYEETLDANGGTRTMGTWKQKFVDLTSHVGQTIYIAFRHFNCSDQFYMDLDEVNVIYYGGIDGCPSMPQLCELKVNEHPQPIAEDVTTYCGIPATLALDDNSIQDGFLYQWSSNENFTDTLALGTELLIEGNTNIGENHYYVRSYREIDEGTFGAREYLLQEGFENGSLEGWRNIDNDEDGQSWIRAQGIPHSGTYMYASVSYDSDEGESYDPDNWLITSKISLPENTDDILLSWAARSYDENNNSYPDHYTVYLSTTGNDISDFTSSSAVLVHDGNAPFLYSSMTFNMTEFAGQDVWIAFRHWNSEDEWVLLLDDIEVSYQPHRIAIGCASPTKDVVLNVLPAPAVQVATEPIICGNPATLTVVDPIQYYNYEWYGDTLSTTPIATTTEYITNPISSDSTIYYVRSSFIDDNSACVTNFTPAMITFRDILAPVVSDTAITCGTPLLLSMDIPQTMTEFTFVWNEGNQEIGRTDINNPYDTLHAKDNFEDRTIYVYACKFLSNGRPICRSKNDTIQVTINPISNLNNPAIYYGREQRDFVCQDDQISIQIRKPTATRDEYNNPITNYSVWYRRHVGVDTDSVLFNYTTSTGFTTIASDTGTWEYYAYHATHLLEATGEGTLNSPISGNTTPGCISFNVTSNYAVSIEIDTISVIPDDPSVEVEVWYSETGNANPWQNPSAWHRNGTYTIYRQGTMAVPIVLDEPIRVRGNYSIYLYTANNLLFEHLDDWQQMASDGHVSISSGYHYASGAYPFGNTTNNNAPTTDQYGRFLGNVHYSLSNETRFGCMSEQAPMKLLTVDLPSEAPDTIIVKRISANAPELPKKSDGFYVCQSDTGLILSTSTHTFGDHAQYVWIKKTETETVFSEFLRTDSAGSSIEIPVPDETTTFGVLISSSYCGATDTVFVKVYVSEVPEVADIQFGPLCAPYTIPSSSIPVVAEDGEWIESYHWQISPDGIVYEDIDEPILTAHNGWYLHYRATTERGCVTGYSNAVQLVVDTAAYFDELPEADAICGGTAFDWVGHTATVHYVNNSGREIRTGWNIFEAGVLQPFDTNFAFYYNANPDYYTYNCYIVTPCGDSIVSNTVSITVWIAPAIERISDPLIDCAGQKIGNYFAEFEDHPEYDDHGSTTTHGWEFAEMPGSDEFVQLSNGLDTLDSEVILDYNMNRKVVRYYVDNNCGRTTSNAVQLTIVDHPYVGELAEIEEVCDGTPFAPTEPAITNNGGIFLYTGGWYLVQNGEITDTVHVGDPMTLDWNDKMLVFGATNTCGTGFSNYVKVTVNPLPAPVISIVRNNDVVTGTEFCYGPDYSLTVATNESCLYEWSDELGADNVVDLGQLEEGDYTYTVVATDENSSCAGTATVTFTISPITFDTTVTICEGELPYTYDAQMQAVYDEEGEYTITYLTAEGCDSVVSLTLNVNRPQVIRTAAYICNGETYEWDKKPGVVYGAGLTDTVLTDTVYLPALTLHSDVTNEICDSIIYALRLSITNEMYLDLPQGDEFTVAVGQQVYAEANVRGGCGNLNHKVAVAYQLFKDEVPVENVNEFGLVNISTYLPVLNTSFGSDIDQGNGEIPDNTFSIQYYDYDFFYSDFFAQVDNRITATLDEPGDYRLQMVIIGKSANSGQNYPMTYHHNNADLVLMGGANATPTDTIFADTVNIFIHVDADLEIEEPDVPVVIYDGDLVIDTTVFTETVNETSSFDVLVTPNVVNAETKLSIDYTITHNGEPVADVNAYGTLRFTTDVPRLDRTFGRDLSAGTGSIPANTFSIVYYNYDFFYNHFIESTQSHFTAQWNVPGDYAVTFTLRERNEGQEIPMAYSDDNTLFIGGHGSSAGTEVISKTINFHIPADTVRINLDETICANELPFVYNGHEFNEAGTHEYNFADESNVYDTLITLNLTVNEPAVYEFADTACESYLWNDVEYTESGDYTQTLTTSNGCDSTVTLHLTILTEPGIQLDLTEVVCENANVTIAAYIIYPAGVNNTTTFSVDADPNFTAEETRRDTTSGFVTVRYAGVLNELAHSTGVTVTSTNSTFVTQASSCVSTSSVEITVIPTDTIAHFTGVVCQGEAYSDNNGFNITAERTMAAVTEGTAAIIRDTIITGTSACGTYRAELVLTVNPSYTADNAVVIEDVVCEGYGYNNYGFSLTADEIAPTNNVAEFSHSVQTASGCDSTTILRLTVTPTIREEISFETCTASYYWNQEIYEESGDYTQTFTAANGCDSVVTLHLTINHPVAENYDVTACESYEWNNETYTVSGVYSQTFTAANSCDSVVTINLTVYHPVAEVVEVTACDSYEWHGEVYSVEGEHTYLYDYTSNEGGCPVTDTLHLTLNMSATATLDSTVTITQLPLEWNGVVFTSATTETVVLETVNGCDSTVIMNVIVNDIPASGDPFMTARTVGVDTIILTAFANQSDMNGKVSIDYHLYKGDNLVEDVDYDCGGRFYIGTEFNGDFYGQELAEAEGNIPSSTFQISNYHYEYFYWAFLNGRVNLITHNFTKPGDYTLVFELRAEEDGQDFPLPYDNDFSHLIGGKNSMPADGALASFHVSFTVTENSGSDDTQSSSGIAMNLSTSESDGSTPVTMGFDVTDGYGNNKVAIRYAIYSGDDEEPLPMLSSMGNVFISTSYNGSDYGDNLTASTGLIPEATFHPMSYYYNYFYAAFLATTHNTITANWTVPGTYKIKFELVQMTGGQDFPLTYGNNFQRFGGKLAEVTNVVYDTKTLTFTSGNTAQNPAITGIADNDGNGDGFVLYPNPARDRAVLTLGHVSEGAFIVVTDVNGKEVHRAIVTDSRIEFNVATWTEGVYFVTLRDNDRIVTKKLVVTK